MNCKPSREWPFAMLATFLIFGCAGLQSTLESTSTLRSLQEANLDGKVGILGEVVTLTRGPSEKMAGVIVKILSTFDTLVTTADVEGCFQVLGLPSGSYTVQAGFPLGWQIGSFGPITIEPNHLLVIDFKLAELVEEPKKMEITVRQPNQWLPATKTAGF